MVVKIFKNKKGEETPQKMLFYVITSIFITILCFIIVYFVVYDLRTETMIPKNLERNLFIQRFLNSEDCFAYTDTKIQRIYPYLLDQKKLTQDTLDKCYSINDDKTILSDAEKKLEEKIKISNEGGIAFRLTFIGAGIVPNNVLKTKNWVDGKNSEQETPIRIKVIDDENEINEAKLVVEVQEGP